MREQSSVPLGLIHFVRFQAEIAGSPACSAGNHGAVTAQTLWVHDSNVIGSSPQSGVVNSLELPKGIILAKLGHEWNGIISFLNYLWSCLKLQVTVMFIK